MRKRCKNFISYLTKLPKMVRNIYQVLRFGGFAEVNVSIVESGSALEGKRILITGGGSGIGLSIARKCVSEGAHVVITGRSSDKLRVAVDKVGATTLKSLVWDVSDVTVAEDRLLEAEKLLGGELDVLVNNAGILLGTAFPNIAESVWDETYAINSKGLFFLTQTVCRRWLQQKNCSIRKVINISSQGGFVGATYPYRMTKWDIVGLTQGLGVKLASKGILVNGIAPGVVVSVMQKKCQAQGGNVYHSDNPSQRFALPEEIAELASFLISDASNFIVGQTIVCDGGYSIK